MDRNVKIALGCGGAGCLGLIVVIAAGVALYFLRDTSSSNTNRNSNYNSNRNSNRSGSNSNSNDNSAANDNDNDDESSSSSSMSDDARHRLFHAASVTRDTNTIERVGKKIGILKNDSTPNEDHVSFIAEHVGWVFRNTEFIQSIDTPAKARAYVNAHIND